MCRQNKIAIQSVLPKNAEEILGVNDKVQLAQLERHYQRDYAEKLMREGVTIADPHRMDIRGTVKDGKDVVIDVNVILEGEVIIGDNCYIGANTILKNVEIGNEVEIKANSVFRGCESCITLCGWPFCSSSSWCAISRTCSYW